MSVKRPATGTFLRAAVGCAFGLGVAMAALPAHAEDEWLDGILKGVGLRKPGEDNGISYRERSPLVVPPGRDLPPPEAASVEANPSWPVEPEIKRAKELKKKTKVNRTGDAWTEDSRPLRPDELDGQRGRISDVGNTRTEEEGQRALRPNELGSKGLFGSMFGKSNEESAKFTGEPPRASLTDPPAGYQTPSTAQPYGLGKERIINKPKDYYSEHGTQQN